jgi:hypothetical protein
MGESAKLSLDPIRGQARNVSAAGRISGAADSAPPAFAVRKTANDATTANVLIMDGILDPIMRSVRE